MSTFIFCFVYLVSLLLTGLLFVFFIRSKQISGGACYDCGLPYDKFPCDMNVSDEIWEKINPSSFEGGGLLCPNCICARLIKLPTITWVYAEPRK